MADALIGIGIDLSQLVKQAGQIPNLVGKDAEKAVKQVQRAAIKASKDIERVQKTAVRAAAKEAQQAQRATQQAAKVLERAELARMSASERAQHELQKELRYLDHLKARGADVAKVEQARASAIVSGARKIAAARQQELGVTQAAGKATTESGRALQSVAMQIPDVITQISAGTSVFQTLVQQGLQVVQVNMGLVLKGAAALATGIKALGAAFLGPLAVGLAAATAAGWTYYWALQEQKEEQRALTAAIESTAVALDPTVVRIYTQAQRDMAKAVADAELLLHQEMGTLDSLEVSQMRAVAATREQAKAAILAARAQFVRLEVERQTLQQAVLSGDLAFDQQVAAQKRLDLLKAEVPLALEQTRILQEQADAQAAQVNETFNQIAAVREQRAAEREAEKATRGRTSATRGLTEAQKAQRQAEKEARAALEAFASALDAARRPFVDQSEVATLRRLQAALIEAADAADLTAMQSAELAGALGQIEDRIAAIDAAPLIALRDTMSEISDVGGAAVSALDEMASEVNASAEDIPAGRIMAQSIVRDFGAGLDKATSMLSIFTGGATAQMNTLAGALQLVAEGPDAARQMAKAAVTFVQAIADNIGAVIRVLTANIDEVAVALAKAIPQVVYAIVRQAPAIAVALVKALGKAIPVLLRTIARQIRRTVEHAFRGGRNSGDRRRNRRRVSDTPGPIRVRNEQAVVAAPGDYVVAARTREGLQAQTGGGGTGSGEVRVVMDVRDGPVRLGMSVATRREMRRMGAGRNSSGRRRVY